MPRTIDTRPASRASLFRHILAALVVLIIAGCSGW